MSDYQRIMNDRRKAVCPTCGKLWKVLIQRGPMTYEGNPVHVIASLIEKSGCWICQEKKMFALRHSAVC